MALRRLLRRLLAIDARRRDDDRLQEELELHLQMQVAENLRAGMAPDEARRRALLTFGPLEAMKESYRDEQRLRLLDDFMLDGRYAFRQLRNSPVFTLTATISLAMGIGANAAVFTIVERLLLRPLPVKDPHELVYVTDERILSQPSPRFSYPFYALVRQNTALKGVAARVAIPLNVTLNGQTSRADGELVSGNYFEVLGAHTQLGRPFSSADDATPGARPVAVISGAFWERELASDPAIVGKTMVLNATTFSIVGVSARGFTGTDIGSPADIWVPLAMQRELGRSLFADVRTNWLEMVGRLRHGESRARVVQALNHDFQMRASELPPQRSPKSLVLVPADKGSSPARGQQRTALLVTFALTALALALASGNITALAAVRSAAREREMAIRLAIGASRSRLERQLLTEALVVAALGGLAALLLAPWTARALVTTYAPSLATELTLDPRILAFVAGTSLLAALVIAIVPIGVSTRIQLTQASGSSAASDGRSTRRLTAHDATVALQIAVALSMLISAGLLVQSLRGLESVEPGFRADNLLLASLDPSSAGYESNRIEGFWRAVLDRVETVPGVQSVSLARTVPMAPGRQRMPWTNPGSGEKVELDTNSVGPQYFRTLGIAVIGGREFNDDDRRGSRPVVVVNQRLAQLFWPGQDAIGKGLRLPEAGNQTAEVVGVVRDVKLRNLRDEAGPIVYRPVLQMQPTDSMVLHVRAADPSLVVNPIRQAIQGIDPGVLLFQVTTLAERLEASFAETRQAALLAGTFSVLAVLLSGIGVYGVAALAVSRRTRDIGIRMALGATRRHIVQANGTRIVALITVGLSLGLIGSFAFARVTGALLFGVSPGDAATFVSMAAFLALVSLAAFIIPVRAASRMDAVAAIRHE